MPLWLKCLTGYLGAAYSRKRNEEVSLFSGTRIAMFWTLHCASSWIEAREPCWMHCYHTTLVTRDSAFLTPLVCWKFAWHTGLDSPLTIGGTFKTLLDVWSTLSPSSLSGPCLQPFSDSCVFSTSLSRRYYFHNFTAVTEVRLMDDPQLSDPLEDFTNRSKDLGAQKWIPVYRQVFQGLVDSKKMTALPEICIRNSWAVERRSERRWWYSTFRWVPGVFRGPLTRRNALISFLDMKTSFLGWDDDLNGQLLTKELGVWWDGVLVSTWVH